jgi:omega-amidase
MSEHMTDDRPRPEATLRVALGQYDIEWQNPDASLARAAAIVDEAATRGAQLVVLPEMCATGFTMDAEQWAESLSGARATRLGAMARQAGVWILAGLAVRDGDGARNAAVAFDPDGEIGAVYYKQRLFRYGGEDGPYTSGDEPVVVDIGGVRVSPFVCYDLRFPELFRAVAREVDAMIVVANWPSARRAHWEALARARAIENQCYFIGVNRTGEGGGLTFDGGSVAFTPWGDLLAGPLGPDAAVSIVELRTADVANVRRKFPFLQDLNPADVHALSRRAVRA